MANLIQARLPLLLLLGQLQQVSRGLNWAGAEWPPLALNDVPWRRFEPPHFLTWAHFIVRVLRLSWLLAGFAGNSESPQHCSVRCRTQF